MTYSKEEYNRVKKAYRRTFEIDPSTRITPSAKINIKKDRAKVDWKTELEEAKAEQDFLDDDLTTGDE